MKTKLLAIILMIIVSIMFLNTNIVHAAGLSDVITGGDNFIGASSSSGVGIDTNKITDVSSMVYNILLTMGIIVAVVIAAILGIKFMIGSVEEKAQVKDSLVPFIIGCVVVFGAFGFWKIFVNIGNEVTDEAKTRTEADYVRGPNGILFEKGKLYCANCKEIVNSTTMSTEKCWHCHEDVKSTCTVCNKKLTQDEILSGKCNGSNGIGSHDISNDVLKYYIFYNK